MNIRFIQATFDDQTYLLWLRKHTMVEHLEQEGLMYSDEQHLERLLQDYSCAHVIWLAGQKLGLLKFNSSDDILDIKQFQLEPRWQGKGLGQKILTHLLSTYSHKSAALTVLKQNPAQRLYLKMGFNIVGEDQYEFHMEKKCGDLYPKSLELHGGGE